MEPMRKALVLTDVQIGLLQGLGLTLAAAFGSVPLAWLADRLDRRWMLAGCIVFWSAATAARGWGHSFRDIMASTSGLALAEARLVPIVFAMIPTLFQARHRPAANIIFYAATALGSSVALILGGGAFAAIESHAVFCRRRSSWSRGEPPRSRWPSSGPSSHCWY
jgi:MFS family permease